MTAPRPDTTARYVTAQQHEAEFVAGLTAVATTLVRMGAVDIRYGHEWTKAGSAWYLTASTSDGREATGYGTVGAMPGVAILEAGASVIKQLDNPSVIREVGRAVGDAGIGVATPGLNRVRAIAAGREAAWLSSSCGRMCHVTPCEACPERRG